MTTDIWLPLAAVILLLIVSFFFSGSETALTAASRARLLQLEKNGDRRASMAGKLLGDRERLIGALLLGNNLVNIAASALATGVLLAIFGEVGMIYATLAMTVIVVIFSEVLPKTIAINAPDRFAMSVAPLVRIVVAVFGPITAAIQMLVRAILRPFGTNIGADTAVLSAHEELRGAVDLLHQEGGVKKADRDMFGGLLDLNELEVSDVMVHRTNMMSLDADLPPAELVKQVLAASYTRIPLWREKPENIIGIVHAKDLLRALDGVNGNPANLDISGLVRQAWFVPDTTPLPAQLRAFLKQKTHFALVVDEYGEVMGLVTLEDIIEEIVGDISDEHDITVQGVRPQPDGSVSVDGSVPIRDLNRVMDWNLPDEEATTVAGLVIHEARIIPNPGQAFTFHGFRFQVLRRQRNRITTLRITPLKPQPSRKTA